MNEPRVHRRDQPGTGLPALAVRYRRAVIFVVAAVLAVLFVVENHRDVTTNFVFFTVTAKLWIGLLVCLALGAVIGYLGAVSWNRRHRS